MAQIIQYKERTGGGGSNQKTKEEQGKKKVNEEKGSQQENSTMTDVLRFCGMRNQCIVDIWNEITL